MTLTLDDIFTTTSNGVVMVETSTITTVEGGMTATLQDIFSTGTIEVVPYGDHTTFVSVTGNPTLPGSPAIHTKHSGAMSSKGLMTEKVLSGLVGIAGALILFV